MNRAVFLPTGAPYNVFKFWLRFVDNLPNANLYIYRNNIMQGKALKNLITGAHEEYLMFIEDDAVVLKKEVIEGYFKDLEEDRFDVLGSPRISSSMELAEAAKNKFNLDYTGLGDKGPAFWPCFFFAKRSILLKTDLHFWPKGWKKGEYIKELDYTVEPEDVCGDVNWWVSIQLRHLGARIKEIPQYHLPAYDLIEYERGHWPWGALDIPYIHIGSLSAEIKEPKSEIEEYEYGRRKFFLDLANGIINDKKRYEAYKKILSDKI